MISRRIDEKSVRKAKQLIDESEKIVITAHKSPDGDAVGSSLAAARVLSAIGKRVHVVLPDDMLENLRSLPGSKEIVIASRYPDFARQLFSEADVILCLDFNAPSRLGAELEAAIKSSHAAKIVIDHHEHPEIEADVLISHPEMCATAYLLFRFLCRLELFNFIDRQAAECILAGIMTDTGNFAHNNSDDPEIYIVVSELLKKGVEKYKIYRNIMECKSADSMRLRAYAIANMRVFNDAACALMTLSRDELNRFHYVKGDTEGLVNEPLAIPEVKWSVFMREESREIRISMRSEDNVAVNAICSQYFEGGGHFNAAGGRFEGTLAQAEARLVELLPEITEKYIRLKK